MTGAIVSCRIGAQNDSTSLVVNSSASNTCAVLLCPPPSTPPLLVDTLQLNVAPDERSFKTSGAAGTSGRNLYVWGFLFEASNLTTEEAPPLPQTESLFFLGVLLHRLISPPAPESLSNRRCSCDYERLGKDVLQRWGQGVARETSEEEVHLSCSIVRVLPLIPLAICQSEEGFSMWLAIFQAIKRRHYYTDPAGQ